MISIDVVLLFVLPDHFLDYWSLVGPGWGNHFLHFIAAFGDTAVDDLYLFPLFRLFEDGRGVLQGELFFLNVTVGGELTGHR